MIHKKYSFAYLGSREVCESKGSKVNDLIGPPYGLWPLNSDPLLTKIGTLRYMKVYIF